MLSNIGEPGMASLQNDQIVKLGQLQEHLKEQERGYLILLERMLGEDTSVNKEGRSSQNSGESFATSVAESASINVDARSDISEASTVSASQAAHFFKVINCISIKITFTVASHCFSWCFLIS